MAVFLCAPLSARVVVTWEYDVDLQNRIDDINRSAQDEIVDPVGFDHVVESYDYKSRLVGLVEQGNDEDIFNALHERGLMLAPNPKEGMIGYVHSYQSDLDGRAVADVMVGRERAWELLACR